MHRRTAALLALAAALSASSPLLLADDVVPEPLFTAVAREVSGERAHETVARLAAYHRVQGSPMMAAAAEEVVLARLRELGVEAKLEQFPSDGATRYGTFVSPMGWEARDAELWVTSASEPDFAPVRLCRFADVPMCLATYSKGGLFSGELVDVGAGTSDADFAGRDVKGKVVLATGYAADVVRAAAPRGAVGAVIAPAPTDRPGHPDMVRYNGVWTHADEMDRTAPAFMISERQAVRLRALLAKGAVTVRGTVEATLGPGKLTLVHAWFRGTEEPEREVLVTAHLDHPKWSANDNASGSAALLEMARTVRALLASKKVPALRRTLHLVWVPEWYGTLAWVSAHPEVRRCGAWDDPRGAADEKGCVLAGLNLDMMGEDVVKTSSHFYATRTPDSVPSFLDALLSGLLDTTRRANLTAVAGTRNPFAAEMAPYEMGSDHDVLIGLGIPASMLGHAGDWTHHSTEDTLEKVDATELRRTTTFATAAALFMATAGSDDWEHLAPRVAAGALAVQAERAARESGEVSEGARARAARASAAVTRLARELTKPPEGAVAPEALGAVPEGAAAGPGPRRLVLLPLDSPIRSLAPEDAAWLGAQRDVPPGALPLVVTETINFMDGRRGAMEIASRVSAELGRDVDAAFVERLVQALARAGLVRLP